MKVHGVTSAVAVGALSTAFWMPPTTIFRKATPEGKSIRLQAVPALSVTLRAIPKRDTETRSIAIAAKQNRRISP